MRFPELRSSSATNETSAPSPAVQISAARTGMGRRASELTAAPAPTAPARATIAYIRPITTSLNGQTEWKSQFIGGAPKRAMSASPATIASARAGASRRARHPPTRASSIAATPK